MKYKLSTTLIAGSLALAGCTTMQAQIRSSGSMGQSDAQYVNTAFELVQVDEQAGKLAATKASDPRVIDLAAKLSAQAVAFTPDLRSAVAVEGHAPPTTLPPNAAAAIKQLATLSGPAFDHQYVADELAIHTRAVAVLQAEAAKTKDGALRTQVGAQLPAVQANLSTLQVLSKEYAKAQG